MKTFSDLSREEKKVLTSEQVEYYSKIECALRGIIIPQKPVNNIKEVIPPTQKFYQIGYESFVFETEQDAQDYLDILSKSLSVKSVGNSYGNPQYVSKRTDLNRDIKTTLLYSEAQAKELKDVLMYNAELEKEEKSYREALKEYNEINSWIWSEIEDINYYDSRVNHYNKILSDYIDLADGDVKIANTFFTKAYNNTSLDDIDSEIVKVIINNVSEVEDNEN